MATIKQLKTKTWTEIKLRNPDKSVCESMELIMIAYREATASRALERYIRSYSSSLATKETYFRTIQDQSHKLAQKDQVIEIYKEKLRRLSASYHDFLFELNTDIDLEDKKPQTKII